MQISLFSKIKSLLNYIFVITVVLVILLYVFSLIRNFFKLNSANSLVDEAKIRLEEEKLRQKQLTEKLELVSSEEYKKSMAKEKLGFVEEGEVVIILPDEETLKKLSPRKILPQKHVLPGANWKKWLRVFFDI